MSEYSQLDNSVHELMFLRLRIKAEILNIIVQYIIQLLLFFSFSGEHSQ